MINKDNLSIKQLERFEKISQEVGMNLFESFSHEQEPHDPELVYEICDLGSEMVALLKLYKEQLQEEGKLPLSHFRNEYENMNIVIDYIEEAIIDLLPKGSVVQKSYTNSFDEN